MAKEIGHSFLSLNNYYVLSVMHVLMDLLFGNLHHIEVHQAGVFVLVLLRQV